MRIEQYNGYAIRRMFSGAKKIGNVSLPDFNDFHFNTKTTSSMSDDKFKEAIIEQAKKDQAAGKFQTQSTAYKNLLKSYVSVASPDRMGLITEALTNIFKNNQAKTKNINYVDLLLWGKITYEKEVDLTYAEFTDSNGEHIATYSNGGWTFYGTKAENARELEFLSVYNKAWDNAAKSTESKTSYTSLDVKV
ncbi:hypothetical protein [Geosporobacter ferrireducens]|uniref:Uncharacterized protein n=1 Tax=Geosporobacter ferrireducens TaxID=1424294 RepID=A0A1D8GLT7_9FIRM|nr:hypothetical protein [Geosporobacter ferrireducens]AOT71871.1 hypothetical protein Gferi_21430 [Geosporobacter ferrireducens]MTI55656.1 hypothetical protein [Geosporobacter ferrireducens]